MNMRFLVCALIAALTGLSAASQAANAPATPAKPRTAKPSGPSGLSDATIEQKIRAKLAKSKIGADHFTVRVQSGVAYWEGRTNVMQHKGAATRMAKTAGASAVVNKIQISEGARQKAAHNLTGSLPRAMVKRQDGSQ